MLVAASNTTTWRLFTCTRNYNWNSYDVTGTDLDSYFLCTSKIGPQINCREILSFICRNYIFYVGGWVDHYVAQSSLYFMDLTSKAGWVLQTGKMNAPGLKGQVLSNYVLEESFNIYKINF